MAFMPATFRRAPIAVAGTAVAFGALPVAAAAAPAPASHAQVSSTKADRAKIKRIAARERANPARTSLVRVALNQKGERYVAGGEPLDKAGAYAVQGEGSRYVDSVEGSFTNVVGLPLRELHELLTLSGVEAALPGGPL